jgi:MFS family permease
MEDNQILVAGAYLAGGFIVAFYGYRLLRLLIALAGFVAAIGIALFFADITFIETEAERAVDLAQTLDEIAAESAIIGVIVTLFIGFIGAVVLSIFYKVGVALLGSLAAGYIAFAILVNQPDMNETTLLGVVLFAAILGALMAVRIERHVIVYSTALIGGFFIVAGGLSILDANDISTTRPLGDSEIDLTNGLILFVAWILIAIFGAYRQLDDAELRYDYV